MGGQTQLVLRELIYGSGGVRRDAVHDDPGLDCLPVKYKSQQLTLGIR